MADTLATIINDAAKQLGLITSTNSDPYASTDANLVQLCQAANSVGRELVKERQWTHLQKTHTFSTSNGTYQYTLPSDFDRMIDQTGWNRTTALPAGGPVDAQAWQMLQALSTAATVTVLFRTTAGQVWLYPTPSSTQTVAFEYMSNGWVTHANTTVGDRVSASTDTLSFDSELLIRGIKLAWLRAKNLPSDAAQQDYDVRLAQVTGTDGAAPVLRLDGSGVVMAPLLSDRNLPVTGLGS
jgi:hypothetical protein